MDFYTADGANERGWGTPFLTKGRRIQILDSVLSFKLNGSGGEGAGETAWMARENRKILDPDLGL